MPPPSSRPVTLRFLCILLRAAGILSRRRLIVVVLLTRKDAGTQGACWRPTATAMQHCERPHHGRPEHDLMLEEPRSPIAARTLPRHMALRRDPTPAGWMRAI